MKILVFLLPIFLFFSCSSWMEDIVSIENNQILNESNSISNKQHMNENIFWKIIESSSEYEEIISKLIKYDEIDIIKFEEILRNKIIEADHYNIMIAQKLIYWYVSDDSFLYFRAWLIFWWKDIFEKTLVNPDFLVEVFWENIENIASIIPNEELLYISDTVFQRKTGKWDDDDSLPRNVCFEKGIDYDSFDLKTKWEDFTDNDLPNRAPKLFKIFGSKDREGLWVSEK